MSDRFRSRFPFGEEKQEGIYRAWIDCQQGEAANLKLVPASGGTDPVRQIPYLQPITIEHHPQTGQLCLLCHSTGMTVFIEGQGLDYLADLIAEKRVRSIHVYDSETHQHEHNRNVMVHNITVEQSS